MQLREPAGEGSTVVFHARTLRKLLDIETHRAACAAPLSFADYWEMQLHQGPDFTVLGLRPAAFHETALGHLQPITNTRDISNPEPQ